jgi:hypothetical protein
MNDQAPDYLCVIPELLKQLLDAATGTALAHRDTPSELYALGQLEATANMAFIMAAGQGFHELEVHCQQVAVEAISRLATLKKREQESDAWHKRVSSLIGRPA